MKRLVRIAHGIVRRIPLDSLHGLHRDLRDLKHIGIADVAFVSYPKSGRTFVRAMLARLYQERYGIDERELLKFATLREASSEVPRIVFTHDGDAMRSMRQIKVSRRAYQDCKVVLLSRHPGDVAVSRYFHLKHRSADPARRKMAEQPLQDFIWTHRGGIPSIVAFLNAWAEVCRAKREVEIVRYEDFLTEPEATLLRLAHFLGLGASEKQVRDAAQFCQFDNLKMLERQGYYTSARLRPRGEKGAKVRSGSSGGFRSQLSEAECSKVEAYIAANLDPIFDYRGRLEIPAAA